MVSGAIKKEDNVNILNDNLKYSAGELSFGRRWCFLQDNDPKYSAKLTSKWLEENSINVLHWLYQSPDLNLTENLWIMSKLKVMA